MPEQTHAAPPDLEARLSEIDARLREIQAGLAPDREPRPAPPVSPPPPPFDAPPPFEPPPPPAPPRVAPPPPHLPRDAHLTAADPQARLLSAMRELLDAYGLVLGQLHAPAASSPELLAVSAGPFASTDAVRAFELALAAIPHVREVALRGYEGENRAIFDVHLMGPTA